MKHKHHDLMIAFAKDSSLRFQKKSDEACVIGGWEECGITCPFHEDEIYRIKPTPKPDLKVERTLTYNISTDNMWTNNKLLPSITPLQDHLCEANIRFIFAGETNKLVEVEIIGE